MPKIQLTERALSKIYVVNPVCLLVVLRHHDRTEQMFLEVVCVPRLSLQDFELVVDGVSPDQIEKTRRELFFHI